MKKIVLICWILFHQLSLLAQARVTSLYSDYNGFFASHSNNINTNYPENSHNLLGFTFNGTTYSTGVDDAKLTANGISFTPQTFRAIPLNNVPTSGGSSYFVGLGQLYDGINNGVNNSSTDPFPGNPVNPATLASFLTDGINGLNLGTGLANIPAGSVLRFNLGASGISAASIGDGIPDILYVQIADPSSGGDKLKFINSNGQTVGVEYTFNLSSTFLFPVVARWKADFYNPNSTQYSSGFINTMRPIAMMAVDLSQLGITTSNYTEVVQLVYTTGGQSDPAFVAFNEPSVNLPTKLGIHSQPTIYQTDIPINPNFEVRLLNSFNQPILQANVPVTVSVESGNGQVSGTITRYTDANGVAHFNDLQLSGNNTHTLRFSSTSLSPAISDPLIMSTLLPLNWVGFHGKQSGNSVHLQWKTNFEQKSYDFIIERSKDAKTWNSIGSIPAAGQSSHFRNYSFIDESPETGLNFYRILQRDIDFKTSYSDFIKVQFSGDNIPSVKVLANPVIARQLQVELFKATEVQLITSGGSLILKRQVPAGRSTIPLDRLAPGLYYLITADKTLPVLVQ